MKLYKRRRDDFKLIIKNISDGSGKQGLINNGFFPCIHYTDTIVAEFLMEIETFDDNQQLRYCPICDVLDTNVFRYVPPKNVWIIKK